MTCGSIRREGRILQLSEIRAFRSPLPTGCAPGPPYLSRPVRVLRLIPALANAPGLAASPTVRWRRLPRPQCGLCGEAVTARRSRGSIGGASVTGDGEAGRQSTDTGALRFVGMDPRCRGRGFAGLHGWTRRSERSRGLRLRLLWKVPGSHESSGYWASTRPYQVHPAPARPGGGVKADVPRGRRGPGVSWSRS